MSHATLARVERLLPDRQTLLLAGLIVNLELIAVLMYVNLSGATFSAPRYLVYPWIWINVGVWAVVRTRPRATSDRYRWLAAGVAVAYFALLAYVGGLVGLGGMATGLAVSWLPPGWGPAVIYGGESLRLILVPFKLVGYLALTYLVYATILDAAGSAVAGLVGLFSCVSCTWPVAASLLTGVLGGTVGFASGGAYSLTYDLSTVVFVVSVGLLYWRPTFDSFRWLWER
jgi:hypothetical protein